MQIAVGMNGHVDQAVTSDLIQPVIEETDAGTNVTLADTVQIDFNVDGRFIGFAVNLSGTHESSSLNSPNRGPIGPQRRITMNYSSVKR